MKYQLLSKVLIAFLIVFAFIIKPIAQEYFQQEVNYIINVELDDKNHFLRGFESFEYINNSPDTLSFILIHLWPNAYSNGNTALADQLYQQGNEILKFITEEDRGFIDSLDFHSDGEKLNWEFDNIHVDIAKIHLPKPLVPNDKIVITTPFRVKIPTGKISRLGHIGQAYQITQWYPKPAVYDRKGWHAMPYLNQGEFYSEFGSFDVSITLPNNYVVGATGDLQNEEEKAFINNLAEETALRFENGFDFSSLKKTPISSTNKKTLRFIQTQVHDFAWFADKTFKVLRGNLTLPHGGENVDLFAMFTPQNAKQWARAIEYLHDGGYYYSLWNGDYPYKQITAVDGTISAGGGMEYPNVTVIGNTSSDLELEIVIVHEVGHNWFYGILGTNERDHGWMDEGLNTLNEVRYIQTKYPDNTFGSDFLLGGSFNFHGLTYRDMNDLLVRSVQSLGIDQPIQTHSADFTSLNYGLVMYQKTGLVFDYAKYYLGEEAFDKAMRAYFDKWKFKHPQPNDLKAVLEESSGKNLDWMFDELIHTTWNIDYKVGCTKHKHGKTITKIKNVGQVDGPIPVTAKKDTLEQTNWIEPGGGKKTEMTFDFEAAKIEIDKENQLPETNRQNNTWDKARIFPRYEPWKVGFISSLNRKDQTNFNLAPALGFNRNDGFMLGVMLHNYSPAIQPLSYLVVPFYGFGSNRISGLADINYTIQPKNAIKTIKYGMTATSFSSDRFNENTAYGALLPYLQFHWYDEQQARPFKHTVHAQGLYTKSNRFISEEEMGAFAFYKLEFNNRDNRFSTKLRNDFIYNNRNQDQMSRLTVESSYAYRYVKKGKSKWIETRFFAGYNLLFDVDALGGNQYRYSMALNGQDGVQDIFLEEFFIDRYATSGLFAQQRRENMGGFLSTSMFGQSTTWLSTLTSYFDLPYIPLFGAFVDLGAVNNGGQTYGLYNAGIGLRAGKVFGVYIPLIMSENIENNHASNSFAERIRFTLNINILNSGGVKKILDR